MFNTEFVALRITTEKKIALRYKFWMFCIPTDGTAQVFCNNKSVQWNGSYLESILNKKHLSIVYHMIR